ALAQATKWGMIVRNPVPLVDPPYGEHEEPKPLTPEQATALLRVACGHEFEQLYTVMLATGLRIGEALGSRWQDVDLERRRLQVPRHLTTIPGRRCHLPPAEVEECPPPHPANPCGRLRPRSAARTRSRVPPYVPLPWPIHDLVFSDEQGEPLV